jgi:hypothetical protein
MKKGVIPAPPEAQKTLTRSSLRLGFSLAVAVIAAAIADPVVEFASNVGWFGHGSYTDGSYLDVVPALLVGIALLALYLVIRGGAVLAGRALPRNVARLLPSIFFFQILTLYVMEMAEQLIVTGHLLGPAIWLGGPLPVSLAVHAAICLVVTLSIARSVRTLAATTLRVIALVRAIATYSLRPAELTVSCRFAGLCFKELSPVLCRIGERGPPLLSH